MRQGPQTATSPFGYVFGNHFYEKTNNVRFLTKLRNSARWQTSLKEADFTMMIISMKIVSMYRRQARFRPQQEVSSSSAPPLIRIIDISTWSFAQTNIGEGGLVGQVTRCMYKGRVPFVVRESVRGIEPFFISSGERWGDKVGQTPRSARQVLELFAASRWWTEIADAVHDADLLKRRVLPNRSFNRAFIRKVFG